MSRQARREAFSAIGETCPHVDEAFSDLHSEISNALELTYYQEQSLWQMLTSCSEKVKQQTTSLRDALIDAYREKNEVKEELEDEAESLRREIQDLQNKIE